MSSPEEIKQAYPEIEPADAALPEPPVDGVPVPDDDNLEAS